MEKHFGCKLRGRIHYTAFAFVGSRQYDPTSLKLVARPIIGMGFAV